MASIQKPNSRSASPTSFVHVKKPEDTQKTLLDTWVCCPKTSPNFQPATSTFANTISYATATKRGQQGMITDLRDAMREEPNPDQEEACDFEIIHKEDTEPQK